MSYSIVSILALIVHVIINQDVLWNRPCKEVSADTALRRFFQAVMVFYITDILWGILHEMLYLPLLYVDTAAYHAAMALTLLLWTRYVVVYLNTRDSFEKILLYSGLGLFVLELTSVAVNFFTPILFSFGDDGMYLRGIAWYIIISLQFIMFLITAFYSHMVAQDSQDATRGRYMTMGYFGLFMCFFILIQFFNPLQPIYAIGLMTGTCLIHTFVLLDEKEEYKARLEAVLCREQEQKQELDSAMHKAYTDPLTGVKSKHAYVEAAERMEHRIHINALKEFGVVVFDLNGLKHVNDTEGHDAGDEYIRHAAKLICRTYKHSPVFRIGGDEFVVTLEGEDYANRTSLLEAFEKEVDRNLEENGLSISSGMAVFEWGRDKTYQVVFNRADERMYRRKQELKARGARMRD